MGQKDFSRAVDGTPRNAMIMPVGKPAMLTPAFNTDPHKVIVPPMPISKIPAAMRKMGWNVSAALMDRWFASPAWQLPPQDKKDGTAPRPMSIDRAHVDEQIVNMAWALGFHRCARKLLTLKDRWRTPNAIALLVQRLLRAGWDTRSEMLLGSEEMSSRQLDELCQVNITDVGNETDTLDDFYGAIGLATLKLAVVGVAYADPNTGRRLFHVRRYAIYLKDFYDFNGFQYLGLWTENGALGKLAMVANAISDGMVYEWNGEGIGHVYNAHFRDFRRNEGKGGDFHIYSDTHWAEVDCLIDLEAALSSLSDSP